MKYDCLNMFPLSLSVRFLHQHGMQSKSKESFRVQIFLIITVNCKITLFAPLLKVDPAIYQQLVAHNYVFAFKVNIPVFSRCQIFKLPFNLFFSLSGNKIIFDKKKWHNSILPATIQWFSSKYFSRNI